MTFIAFCRLTTPPCAGPRIVCVRTQKSRDRNRWWHFGNPAISERPNRLSAPPSRMVKYYRLSPAERKGHKKNQAAVYRVWYFGNLAVSV